MEIIAELGVNYESLNLIPWMMGKCKAYGLDLVKLQLFTKDMVPEELQDRYISRESAEELVNLGKRNKQEVFFSVMYPEAIDICSEINVNFYKIRFNDQNNIVLYRKLKKVFGIENKTIFVSCQNPQDTVYWNWSNYNKNIKFLYCVPHYPAMLWEYNDWGLQKKISGFSDHTPDTKLLEMNLKSDQIEWFELHVCDNKEEAYEGKWSKSFEELKEVLHRNER